MYKIELVSIGDAEVETEDEKMTMIEKCTDILCTRYCNFAVGPSCYWTMNDNEILAESNEALCTTSCTERNLRT
jgi:hypothetical protein